MAGKPTYEELEKRVHELENSQSGSEIERLLNERKLAETALKESEERYCLTYNASPDAININRLEDGLYVDINDGFTRLTGFTRQDAIGKTSLEINIWDDPADRQKLVRGLKEKGYYENLEARFRRKDGSLTTALMSARVIQLKGVAHIISITRDISERKQAEKTIQIQAETLNAVFNSMPGTLVILNEENRIEKINKNGLAFSARNENKVIGLLGGEAFNCRTAFEGAGCGREPACRLCPVLTRVNATRRTGEPHVREEGQMTFLINGSNVTLDLLISTVLVEFGGTAKVLLSVTDITDLKNAEREKAFLEAQLQKAQRMETIGTLAGGIAHDFNNILFPIIGLSEMLLDDLPPQSAEHENVEQIFKAARRATDLLKQILAFSRQSEHKKIPVRIQPILKEAVKLSRASIPSNITISKDISNDCGLAMADPAQLHQVAMNLITNAYHAVELAGGTISVGLHESVLSLEDLADTCLAPGTYAVIGLADTGHGIEPAVMPKIFEPYFYDQGPEQGNRAGAFGGLWHREGTRRRHSCGKCCRQRDHVYGFPARVKHRHAGGACAEKGPTLPKRHRKDLAR